MAGLAVHVRSNREAIIAIREGAHRYIYENALKLCTNWSKCSTYLGSHIVFIKAFRYTRIRAYKQQLIWFFEDTQGRQNLSTMIAQLCSRIPALRLACNTGKSTRTVHNARRGSTLSPMLSWRSGSLLQARDIVEANTFSW